jgi:hypothetical protein
MLSPSAEILKILWSYVGVAAMQNTKKQSWSLRRVVAVDMMPYIIIHYIQLGNVSSDTAIVV